MNVSNTIDRQIKRPAQSRKGRPGDGILTLLSMLALTALVYYLWICVYYHSGAFVVPTSDDLAQIPGPTAGSVGIFALWISVQILLYRFAPGKWCEGTPLADGSRLAYRINGWFSFCISLVLFGVAAASGLMPLALLYEQAGPLLSTATIFAYVFSLLLYLLGAPPRDAKDGSGVRAYFLGITLNPRIGNFDLKFFCESRPGLIAWVLLDLSLAAEQWRQHGSLTMPMCLVVAFQFLYVADFFWHEEAILTTWDIKHENFGWMLAWGDLVWVPFIYSLQAFYLVQHTHELPWWGVAAIIALNLFGYVLFRGANRQKHRFRRDPEGLIWGKKPAYISTERGSLLSSGWWGIARHVNYTGDLMMALAWCLPCLFGSPLPYFYVIFFLVLLLHRERRDHSACLGKYGADWEEYCRRVRWRMIPYVY